MASSLLLRGTLSPRIFPRPVPLLALRAISGIHAVAEGGCRSIDSPPSRRPRSASRVLRGTPILELAARPDRPRWRRPASVRGAPFGSETGGDDKYDEGDDDDEDGDEGSLEGGSDPPGGGGGGSKRRPPSVLLSLPHPITPGHALGLLQSHSRGGRPVRLSDFHSLAASARPGYRRDARAILRALKDFRRRNSFRVDRKGARLAMDGLIRGWTPLAESDEDREWRERRTARAGAGAMGAEGPVGVEAEKAKGEGEDDDDDDDSSSSSSEEESEEEDGDEGGESEGVDAPETYHKIATVVPASALPLERIEAILFAFEDGFLDESTGIYYALRTQVVEKHLGFLFDEIKNADGVRLPPDFDHRLHDTLEGGPGPVPLKFKVRRRMVRWAEFVARKEREKAREEMGGGYGEGWTPEQALAVRAVHTACSVVRSLTVRGSCPERRMRRRASSRYRKSLRVVPDEEGRAFPSTIELAVNLLTELGASSLCVKEWCLSHYRSFHFEVPEGTMEMYLERRRKERKRDNWNKYKRKKREAREMAEAEAGAGEGDAEAA